MKFNTIEYDVNWLTDGITIQDIIKFQSTMKKVKRQYEKYKMELYDLTDIAKMAFGIHNNPYLHIMGELEIIDFIKVDDDKILNDVDVHFKLKGRQKPKYGFSSYFTSNVYGDLIRAIDRYNTAIGLINAAYECKDDLLAKADRFEESLKCYMHRIYGNSNYSKSILRLSDNKTESRNGEPEYRVDYVYLADWKICSSYDVYTMDSLLSRNLFVEYFHDLYPEKFI